MGRVTFVRDYAGGRASWESARIGTIISPISAANQPCVLVLSGGGGGWMGSRYTIEQKFRTNALI